MRVASSMNRHSFGQQWRQQPSRSVVHIGPVIGIYVPAHSFLANQVLTKSRPANEHRFQLKYGSKDGKLHQLCQDTFGLYTTLLVGINPKRGFFVGTDPVLDSPTR
jgi:hypothetical protein